jgi:hypothetical protein
LRKSDEPKCCDSQHGFFKNVVACDPRLEGKFCFQVGDGLIATRQGAFTWPILVAPDKIRRFF